MEWVIVSAFGSFFSLAESVFAINVIQMSARSCQDSVSSFSEQIKWLSFIIASEKNYSEQVGQTRDGLHKFPSVQHFYQSLFNVSIKLLTTHWNFEPHFRVYSVTMLDCALGNMILATNGTQNCSIVSISVSLLFPVRSYVFQSSPTCSYH